jgi:hypothetical protein
MRVTIQGCLEVAPRTSILICHALIFIQRSSSPILAFPTICWSIRVNPGLLDDRVEGHVSLNGLNRLDE